MNQYQPGLGGGPGIDSTIERAARWRRSQWGAPEQEADGSPPFDLRALLGLARRQKWTIVATTLFGLGLGVVYVSQVDRQYTATTLLVVDARQSELLGVQNGLNDTLGTNTVVNTEMEIIRSSSVLLRAAEALGLERTTLGTERSRLDNLLSAVGLGPEAPETPATPRIWDNLTEIEQTKLADELGDRLQVTQRVGANVIAIAAITTSPELSALWANGVAEAYLEQQVVSKLEARQRTVTVLSARVAELGADVGAIEGQIDAFVFQAVDQAGTPAAREVLANLRGELGALDAQRAAIGDINLALGRADVDQLAILVQDQNPDLVARRTTFAQELAVETNAERAARIREDLAALENEIRAAAAARAAALQTELTNQQEVVGALQNELDNVVAAQALPNDMLVELFQLQANAETTRSLYSTFLTRLREAEQEGGLIVPDSRVIAVAVAPAAPSYPSVRSTLMMALLLAGAAGFGLAFLRENLLGGITSVDHLEQLSGVPVVAAVPKYRPQGKEEPDSAIIGQPLSAFSEAIRRARVGIESLSVGQQVRLLVTSAAPGEGKTTTALSIARAFAMAGKATILIDADLRHPSVAKHFGREVEFGLIDYLLNGGNAEASQRFLIRESGSGLTVMLGSKPSETATDSLLLSQRFAAVMQYATKQYECVVIDSPPVGLVVDPQVIARQYASHALFVVKAEATALRTVRSALRDLAMHSNVPVLGLLNQVPAMDRYYGKYGTYYR